MKEHFRRSLAMSAKVCGQLWLLSRSCAANVRTSCWAAHWRCCEESLVDRQQAASALASSRGPTAEGLWEGLAYKCAIKPAWHENRVTGSQREPDEQTEKTKCQQKKKTKMTQQWRDRMKISRLWFSHTHRRTHVFPHNDDGWGLWGGVT